MGYRPEILDLLVAPRRALADARAATAAEPPTWPEVAALWSVPTVLVATSLAVGYASALLAPHYVANVAFLAASFGIQASAASAASFLVYRQRPREILPVFVRTVVPQEVFFVATAVVALTNLPVGVMAALWLALVCLVWKATLTVLFFVELGSSAGVGGKRRAVFAALVHYTLIAVVVGLYARWMDLLPYPPGRP